MKLVTICCSRFEAFATLGTPVVVIPRARENDDGDHLPGGEAEEAGNLLCQQPS